MITIVIPLFNGEKYISRAIKSCLEQKMVSQIIVIDDASEDKSVQIVQNLIDNNPTTTIELLRNEINSGPGVSRNKGIPIAKGAYIAFLDADDYYKPERFEKAISLFKNYSDIDGIYSSLIVQTKRDVPSFTEEDYLIDKKDGEQISFEDMLLRSRGVSHCGMVFKKSFIDLHNIRYGNTYWGEDTEMLFRAIQKGKIVFLNDPKSIRGVTGNNLTLTLDPIEKYQFHKKCFNEMLQSDYPRAVNVYFLKNLIRKHPIFDNRHTPLSRIPKFIWLMAKIITTPKLWSKLL